MCILVKRHTISLLFLSVLCWKDPRDWWGSGKPGITVDVEEGSYSDPGIFPCSLWNYSCLLQSTLCSWVEHAWGNTSETPSGVSLSEPFTSLILIIIMEPNSPKKIQFAVPLFQSQIAPEAAEQVRGTGWGPVPVCKWYTLTFLLLIESFHTSWICLTLWLSRRCKWEIISFPSAFVFELHWETIA